MSRWSIIAVLMSALVGSVLLVAGFQTLAVVSAWPGDPVVLPVIDATTVVLPQSVQFTPQAGTAPAATTATIGMQPEVICWFCTPEPIATSTPTMRSLSATPLLSSPTPRRSTPTVTRTPGLTRTPTRTPTRQAPGVTPTLRPATATPTQTPATATMMPTPSVSGTAVPGATLAPTIMPPAPNATVQLWMASDFDPSAGIYRSAGTTISWPAGEVLNFTPAVTIVDPPAPDPAISYRSRAIAWSFVSSGGQSVHRVDAMGHSGCRLRAEPAPGDAVGLDGCAYRFLEQPTTDAMRLQAHAFWSAGTPLDMCIDVYTYDLGQLRTTDLTLQVAIRTEAIDRVTGQVLGSTTTITTARFAVRLVAPRSTR